MDTDGAYLKLPNRVEDWGEATRLTLLDLIVENAIWTPLRVYVVGSYCFGRRDNNPPNDIDLVIEVPVEEFDIATDRAGWTCIRRYFPVGAAIHKTFGVRSDPFYKNVLSWQTTNGRDMPRYDLRTGTVEGKTWGESIEGSIKMIDGHLYAWYAKQ